MLKGLLPLSLYPVYFQLCTSLETILMIDILFKITKNWQESKLKQIFKEVGKKQLFPTYNTYVVKRRKGLKKEKTMETIASLNGCFCILG